MRWHSERAMCENGVSRMQNPFTGSLIEQADQLSLWPNRPCHCFSSKQKGGKRTWSLLQFAYPHFFLRFFFFMWTIFKFNWICYNIASGLGFGFWLRGMWDLSSLTGDQTSSPTLEGEVSTTVVPGKSCLSFKKKKKKNWLRLQWPNHSRFLGIWVASHNVTPKLTIIFIFILFSNIYFWWWVSYTTMKACFVGKFAHYLAGLTTLPTLVKRRFTGFFNGMLNTQHSHCGVPMHFPHAANGTSLWTWTCTCYLLSTPSSSWNHVKTGLYTPLFLFLFSINFYWRIVALQCRVSFCTAKWIGYTYNPSFWDFLLI